MRIKDIKVWRADLENTKPYTIAFKTVDEVLNAFVEITLDTENYISLLTENDENIII